MHLNPTYAARETLLDEAFRKERFTPPFLKDVAKAALRAKNSGISLFIGLSDEGLAIPGGSFIRGTDGPLIELKNWKNSTEPRIIPYLNLSFESDKIEQQRSKSR